MSPIDLALFISRVESICVEMGAILQRSALSPNIKDRLDFSCALFDAEGKLFGQASHIPVHLGSMAYAMAEIVNAQTWVAGDILVLNDPFLGGTHLPDVTVISPFFSESKRFSSNAEVLLGFVVNRAHHANIGASCPGSMPLSKHMSEEGLLIPPTFIAKAGIVDEFKLNQIGESTGAETRGDFAAQISANRRGLERLQSLFQKMGSSDYQAAIGAVNHYGSKVAKSIIKKIPPGTYTFHDFMDGDGFEAGNVIISVSLEVSVDHIRVDFSGSCGQVPGNINCPISVTAAAVYYVFRCLLPKTTPNCAGTFEALTLIVPKASLINAEYPAATSAGNVETSMRIVDVMLGAMSKALPHQIPAASQGTMNNVAIGSHHDEHETDKRWDYYETIGGGMGAGEGFSGLSAVQCHMTNTLNTPIESVESHYPLRIIRYEIRSGSGGDGAFKGGNGIIREFEFLAEAELTILTERRSRQPWGLLGGGSGQTGINRLDKQTLPGKCYKKVLPGQVLRIETPGGGGYGVPK